MSAAVSSPGDATSDLDCAICLLLCRDPVVSRCGHLFCWSCVYSWLRIRDGAAAADCPVCKTVISADALIPLYGRKTRQSEPQQTEIPPRPNAVAPSATVQPDIDTDAAVAAPTPSWSGNLLSGAATIGLFGANEYDFSAAYGVAPMIFGMTMTRTNTITIRRDATANTTAQTTNSGTNGGASSSSSGTGNADSSIVGSIRSALWSSSTSASSDTDTVSRILKLIGVVMILLLLMY